MSALQRGSLLWEGLRRTRARRPDKVALVAGREARTFAELDDLSSCLGNGLRERGIGIGDRVAFRFFNGIESAICYFACFKAGAVAVPISPGLKAPEIRHILSHSGARVLLVDRALSGEVERAREEGIETLEDCFVAGERHDSTERPFDELSSATPSPEPVGVAEDALALLMYTSGTTARPKGVMHTHRSVRSAVENWLQACNWDDGDVIALFTNMFAATGLARQLLPAVSVGATCVVFARFDAPEVVAGLKRYGATRLFGLPHQIHALLEVPDIREVKTIRYCGSGGDAVPLDLQERFEKAVGTRIVPACGMTELLTDYASNPMAGPIQGGAIGIPTPGVALKIVDEHGATVPTNEPGEILVKSGAMMAGYWKDPELTGRVLRDGWLSTRDIARMDADGYVWFLGRKSDIIVRGGRKVAPLAVEAALLEHAAVKEAGVYGRPDAVLGQTVHACVVRAEDNQVSTRELAEFLRSRLEDYKIPETFTFVDRLPRGPSGKLDRRALGSHATTSGSSPGRQ